MAFRASSDGGRTFGPVRYLHPNIPGGQFDPQLVTDGAGDLLASWMEGSRGSCSRSRPITGGRGLRSGRVPRSRLGRSLRGWASVNGPHAHRFQPRCELGSAVATRCHVVAPSRSAPTPPHFANGTVTDDGNVVISTASYALPLTVGRRRRSGRGRAVHRRGATFDSTIVDTVECLVAA
jgi:hypothetical protein